MAPKMTWNQEKDLYRDESQMYAHTGYNTWDKYPPLDGVKWVSTFIINQA